MFFSLKYLKEQVWKQILYKCHYMSDAEKVKTDIGNTIAPLMLGYKQSAKRVFSDSVYTGAPSDTLSLQHERATEKMSSSPCLSFKKIALWHLIRTPCKLGPRLYNTMREPVISKT